jgi:hypothetical protein
MKLASVSNRVVPCLNRNVTVCGLTLDCFCQAEGNCCCGGGVDVSKRQQALGQAAGYNLTSTIVGYTLSRPL